MNNLNLRKAKRQKSDEFYTLPEDIERELNYYSDDLQEKKVLLSCDSLESGFWSYFQSRFDELGLDLLRAVEYRPNSRGILHTFDGRSMESIQLAGNGDFRSQECLQVMRESDTVITNPPFSLFRDFLCAVSDMGKSFVLWGNNNAVSYKPIFLMLKEEKLRIGYTHNKTLHFRIPDEYPSWDNRYTEKMNDGHKYAVGPGISVFTNLDIKSKRPIPFRKDYNIKEYEVFDHYPEIINVGRIKDIPLGYEGLMAVPITILGYDLSGYKILDLLNRYAVLDTWGKNEAIRSEVSHSCNINGHSTYARVVIQKIP